MSQASMVQSLLFFSQKLDRDGLLNLLQRLTQLEATFVEFGANEESYDAVEAYLANPEREWFRFALVGCKCTLSVIKPPGHLLFAAGMDFVAPAHNEQVAKTLLRVVEETVPLLSFQYGYLDFQGRNIPKDKEVKSGKLSTVFWVNFFGREYIERLGREFLLGAPGWKTAELPDGTIEYVTTESVFSPPDRTLEDMIVKYFSAKAKVKRYRPLPLEP